jgi:hypothetical protein
LQLDYRLRQAEAPSPHVPRMVHKKKAPRAINVFTSAAPGSHGTYRLFSAFPVLVGNFSDIAVKRLA